MNGLLDNSLVGDWLKKSEVDDLYRINAAAKRWNVAEKTARVWISQGRVAHVRVGRGIRVPLSEINRVIEEGYRPAKDVS